MTDLRQRYEEVERAVCDQVPFEISHVPDDREQRYDAVLDQPIAVSPPIVRSATTDTPVEIKTCQRRIASGRSGQWVFHEGPHKWLSENDGRYLLAVLDEFSVEHWAVCGPADLHNHLDWFEVSTQGYEQSATIIWHLVFGESRSVLATDGGDDGAE